MPRRVAPPRTPTRPSEVCCPRCERVVAPDKVGTWALADLRLIDPHVARYALSGGRDRITLCKGCEQHLRGMAREIAAYRQRLLRQWPTPTAPKQALPLDQELSRTFEAVRDTALVEVLARAISHAQAGATAYLTIYEDDEWEVWGVPPGQDPPCAAYQASLSVPIPLAPGAAALAAEEDLTALSLPALYERCITTAATRDLLEQELATRFYRGLYGREGPR